MKTSLTHLPQHKQEELKTLTEIIQAKVPAEMIILFGSYARGDWVEDFQEKYEYVSDFDILIVTKDKNSAKQVKKSRELEEELMAN
ncbi:nucleotidyltransferase domain-containing protein [Dyadobacter sp. CY261]|uniref:nucleotidyltransferase domain-containing protein n=1 Tax=Dyadobacter sp. CY261 TaxID=2907203 RepID=UPI001F1BC837|nr:nucleotidyltransferase domain-containing protein [Dyadobacter sp. CY261]MCF0075300.1 nucleotidyltransferase domain-containing protein [Dyadobacter sp. CY261]